MGAYQACEVQLPQVPPVVLSRILFFTSGAPNLLMRSKLSLFLKGLTLKRGPSIIFVSYHHFPFVSLTDCYCLILHGIHRQRPFFSRPLHT